MGAKSSLVETVGGVDGERERYQVENGENQPALYIEISDNNSYSASWDTDVGFEEFEGIIRENYESPGEVETLGVFRQGEDDLGERLESTFDRVMDHEYPGGELNYLEFRHGYHTVSLGRRSESNELSLDVRDSDIEPLHRYFPMTTDLPEMRAVLYEADDVLVVNLDI